MHIVRMIFLLLLLLFVVALVTWRHPQQNGEVRSWEGGGTLSNGFVDSATAVPVLDASAQGFDVAIPSPVTAVPSVGNTGSSSGDDAWEALITSLVSHRTNNTTSFASSSEPSAYSFIPGGISAPVPTKTMTPEQRSLYEYANAVGTAIQAFESGHTDMPAILQAQAQNPSDTRAREVLKQLARDFTQLAKDVASISPPSSIATAAAGLSAGYNGMGEKLLLVPDAVTDQQRIDAMLAYNSAADEYIRSVVGLADLFSAFGVKFEKTDPGAIFSFSAASL